MIEKNDCMLSPKQRNTITDWLNQNGDPEVEAYVEKLLDTTKLDIFIERMNKLGIDIKIGGNYPRIYIDSVDGNKVKPEDYFQGNHGFTIAFLPIRNNQEMKFTDISMIFKLIRKYKKK